MGAHPTQKILWLALLSAQGMFLVVGELSAQPVEVPPETLVIGMLAAAAVTDAVLSFVLRQRFLRQALDGLAVQIEEGPDPQAEAMFRDAVPTKRFFTDTGPLLAKIDIRYQTPFILGVALASAVGIMGMVIRMIGGDALFQYGFGALAILCILLHYPTRERPIQMLESMHDATWPRDGQPRQSPPT